MFNHLELPSSWSNQFTKYPEGFTMLEAVSKWVNETNKFIDKLNTVDPSIKAMEKSNDITNNRKLSPKGDFTGTVAGRKSNLLLAGIDTNRDQLAYIGAQMSNGQTGKVIDGGFFTDSGIRKNYDGGKF